MLNMPQLEEAMKTCYPISISNSTRAKREANIFSFWDLIDIAKLENKLNYQEKEERLELFRTKAGEIISIQYPGKESAESGAKKRPYDFRPKIQSTNGTILRDFVFKDMWSLVENLNASHPDMLKTLAALFFQLGRMTNHSTITEDYPYIVLDKNGSIVCSGARTLTWNKLSIRDDILESLNFFIPTVNIDEDTSISFEAFIYFFDLVLQNEDSKYYYKKHNLSSGRIQTSDSMLLLVSYFRGQTSLSTLLQRYVSGFGVCKCLSTEISPATGNLIQVVDRKEDIKKLLTDLHIDYSLNCYVTVNGESIATSLKTNAPKIAILKEADETKKEKLESKEWMVFDFESALDSKYYQMIIDAYNQ